MDDDFSVSVEKHDLYTRCSVHGAVTSSSYKVFHDALEEVLQEKVDTKKYFVIDFSSVTIFSSTCINVIISLNEKIEESNWELISISPQEDARDLLDATGFSRIYPVYETMESFLRDKRIDE